MNAPKFVRADLTEETILKTREHFFNIKMACIDDVKSGKLILPKHTDQATYFAERYKSAMDSMLGRNDHTLTFLQRAHWIQTGDMFALLPKDQ